MDTDALSHGPCPVARGLARAGDGWSWLILRDAGLGVARFDEFRTRLGIAPNILTSRLKALTAHGLLEKRRYSERPPRHEYVLTEAGRDFLPVLQVLGAWGARHCGGGTLNRLVDAETGHTVRAVVVDQTNGAPLGTRRLRMVTAEEALAEA
ncbi:helix-turn-helix transcriptional regulator [Roseomonas aerophila]|uniref:Helix-turn-helix transcriptional regulator n=1 Tax=Teichococcus aerophilus TaxID=1224513 RepID=A0ABR7RPS7_9PROT|nr:helix-turn-helix domain-containing protein [Pseudoroseomonas aerophila]MBC9208596.1 helix-turn-helix transcriptional regulator [Pseudoroseomonas aerophila]